MSEDLALSAAGYVPPTQVASSVDVATLIQSAVAQALAQREAELAAANAPKVQTPEEAARAALDNAGAGLGVDERLAELYRHVALIAAKVGI